MSISGVNSSYSNYYSGLDSLRSLTRSATSATESDNPLQQLFSKLDSDGDGSISSDELTSAASSSGLSDTSSSDLFSALDANGDGSISSDELDSVLQASAPPKPDDQDSGQAYRQLAEALQQYQSVGSYLTQSTGSTISIAA
jgi:Ca2+-binding EF-hand superfamily protein